MRLRAPIALVLTALACAALAGCRTNVGVAARVNGETISESHVTSYLTEKGVQPALASRAKAAGQELTPARVIVLQYEIQAKLFRRALERNGGVPTDGRLAQFRDRAVAAIAGNGQAVTDKQLSTQLNQVGVTSRFTSHYTHVLELEYVLIARRKLTERAQLNRLVEKAGAKVSVSPRYGKWDAAQQSLDGTAAAGLPAFLKLQPSGSAQNSGSALPPK